MATTTQYGATPAGHSLTTGEATDQKSSYGPVIIQVHSARFLVDLGHLTKQDPYIKVKIGLHKERTTSKTRAGKSVVWDETLTFTKLERVTGTDHIVHITARDKNLLRDNIIGKASMPLSTLLSQQGHREIELFDPKDASKLTGHLSMTVSGGEGFERSGMTSGHDKGLTSGHGMHGAGLGAAPLGASAAPGTGVGAGTGPGTGHQNLVIQVHSAQFTHDIGTTAKQDPYIRITVGHQTEKTSAKTRAGKGAIWGETLTFTKLERLTDGKVHDVIISARDKDIIKDDEIGNVKIPLSELLRYQGQQREYDLFDPKDTSKLAGRVSLTVSQGEGVGDGRHHGLGAGGLAGALEHKTDPSVGAGYGTGAGTDPSLAAAPPAAAPAAAGHHEHHGLGRLGHHATPDHPGSGNLAIQVHSAQFVHDAGFLTKQDPYIRITVGDQSKRTRAISRAGKAVTWEETLTFTNVNQLGTKTVLISAWDKDFIRDDDIGRVSIPLSELLRHQGQHEYELFEPKDASKIAGRVTLTVTADHTAQTGQVTGTTY